MSFLIDTNIISEVRKGARCNPGVTRWWTEVADGDIWMSALVVGEIRKGIERARRRDREQASVLEAWLGEVVSGFADRLLAVDMAVAEEWGRMSAIRPVPVIDALLAATAKVNDLTLVTRNEADVAGLGIEVLNPFSA